LENWPRVGEDEEYHLRHRKMINRKFKAPDGQIRDFDIMESGDAVCVLALTKDMKIVLAKQFRPGPERVLMELPGGLIDQSDLEPADAIRRELLEETGYSGNIQLIGRTVRDAYFTGYRYHFIATGCVKIREPKNDDNEFIEVVKLSIPEFIDHLKIGNFTDALTGYMGAYFLGLI
jgi:ADP-ribose pyrophosphatase